MGLSASNSSAAFHPPLAVAFSTLFKIPWVEAPARGLELSQVLPQNHFPGKHLEYSRLFHPRTADPLCGGVFVLCAPPLSYTVFEDPFSY